jgi:fatty aldehyde-generating acyl-ACP reductase
VRRRPVRSGPWFAFLAHPRDLDDAHRGPGGRLLRAYSRDDADFRAKLCGMPPTVFGEIRFAFESAWGELLAVFRMPDEMVGEGAGGAVAEGLSVAARRGARVVGLGALTSPATGGGLRLLPGLPPGVTVTNGNAYTAAVVCANVVEAARFLGLGRRARVGVVGCTGSVGFAASHLLAEERFRLRLNGRTAASARRLLGHLPNAEVGAGTEGLDEVDVAILLTADPAARVGPESVRAGAVVVDCAQPANVAAGDVAPLAERGVAVAEGGLVRIPGYSCSFDFRLAAPGAAFACLAETYLFACEGLREHSVGRPSPELARRLERIAERRGIEPLPLHLKSGGTLGEFDNAARVAAVG